MTTLNQLIKKKRINKKKKTSVLKLNKCPLKRGVVMEVRNSVSPKKPNSAKRKVAKVKISSTNKFITAAISGIGHNLQRYSVVLIRGGHARDIPGVRYKLIKGKYDYGWKENINRSKSRSKYGKTLKDWKNERIELQ